jgi:hypothetical protein
VVGSKSEEASKAIVPLVMQLPVLGITVCSHAAVDSAISIAACQQPSALVLPEWLPLQMGGYLWAFDMMILMLFLCATVVHYFVMHSPTSL